MSEGPALRVDGERVSPDRFYATACDPARSVVVEACAGSGKTWMLVSRIVRLLLDGVEPHHILAITFTRAAAGEMRDRLAGWLAEWSMRSSVEDRVEQLKVRGIDADDAVRLESTLRALGEGSVCEWCDVRGLCRRDDWQAEVQGLADATQETGR